MGHFWNFNLWNKKSRGTGLLLLRYCDKLQERLESERDLPDRDREAIKTAIHRALNALDLANGGHKSGKGIPSDLLKKEEENIKKFVPKGEWIQSTEDEDEDEKSKLATAINMIRDISESAASPMKYPIDVKLCKCSTKSVNPIHETLEYSFTRESYTLDDLLYIVRLRRPDALKQHPYLYCRPIRAHRRTHEGSKFERRNPPDPLIGLTRNEEDDVGVVYLIAPEHEFILLIKGVPFKAGEKGKDEFYIVHELESRTTDVISESKSKTRTFHHVSETSWSYRCEPGLNSGTTWKNHRDQKQLTLYEGEWFVSVPREASAGESVP